MAALRIWTETNAQVKIGIPIMNSYTDQMKAIEKASYSKSLEMYWESNDTALKKFEVSTKRIAVTVRNAFAGMAGAVGKALGEMAAGVGSSGIEAALLGAVGSLVTNLGELAIEIGFGLLAIKEAFMSLNPYLAIAAGIALVALGSYFSTQAQSIGSSGGAGGSASSGGGGSSRMGDLAIAPVKVDLSGELVARGPDLVYAIDKQKYKNGRVGG